MFSFLGVTDPNLPEPQLDPETLQRQLFAIMHAVPRAQATRGVTQVVLIDDLHWVDPGSDVFVEQMVEAADGNRTLILLNFRPEYQAIWTRKAHYHQLPLTPLSTDAVRDLVASLLGDDESLSGLAGRIVDWTAATHSLQKK